MIRSSSLTLQFSTNKKLNILNTVFDEYTRIVNLYINEYTQSRILPKFISLKVETWLSARLQQCAGKQALEIVKSTRKKAFEIRQRKYKKVYRYFVEKNRQLKFLSKKMSELNLNYKIKPRFDGKTINLDTRFWRLSSSTNSFDFWLILGSIGNKIKLILPLKNHKHNKKFNDWKQLSSCRLLRNNGKFKIELIYEIETPVLQKEKKELAIDAGINCLLSCSDGNQYGLELKQLISELNNKQQKSHSYDRKLNQIHNYIRWCVNQLDFASLSDLILEKLKYIQIGTKNRVNKTTRKLLKNWNLGLLHSAIKQKCEENCVHLHYVNPKYTSRTCPICGHIDKRNREGTIFKCVKCGFEDNADINAAKNILSRFHQENSLVSDIVPDSTKIRNKIVYFSNNYLSEIAIVAKPYQKFSFEDDMFNCYFTDKNVLCKVGEDLEDKPVSLDREHMAEPRWKFVD